MSYKVDKFSLFSSEDNPSAQEISTTYTEITGSKCEVKSYNTNPKILYKFSFLISSLSFSDRSFYLHIKLQKSNDNFSSNIVDIPNCMFNNSGDTHNASDNSFQTCTAMFILENFDSKYLRLVSRSRSGSYQARLHTVTDYDDGTPSGIYYNPSLIVAEL